MVRSQDRKFVSADPEKCIGCLVCEYACSMTKENTFNPTKSRIRALRLSEGRFVSRRKHGHNYGR
jgi:Fe-S-cluster-containing dehydrogenase component